MGSMLGGIAGAGRAFLLALLLCIAGGLLGPSAAWAHKASGAYLTIRIPPADSAQGIQGRWDIALRDLDYALGLDADGDGELTWGEIRARHGEIAAYAAQRLTLQVQERECRLSVGEQQIDEHTDGAYSVLPLSWDCPRPVGAFSLDYRLFADLDPQHRGLLNLLVDGRSRTAVLGGEAAQQRFEMDPGQAPGVWPTLRDFSLQGVWHIWIGFDHILFLVSLLLPAVLIRVGSQWRAAQRLREASLEVVKVVTAFTVAHSITLSLAALQWVSLPSRAVESAIAASVVLAALNNIHPVALARRWWVAFAFGLIHGFGFASVLADLGLPSGALVLALLGFNLGVEFGQLAIVLVFMFLAWRIRGTGLYRQGVMTGGSLLIALLATVWLVERLFDLRLLG